MTRRRAMLVVAVLGLASLMAGVWHIQRTVAKTTEAGGRRVLYYVDPMHPAYRSDKPGIAPDCGMQLEPVYADGGPNGGAESRLAATPPGAVAITAAGQHLAGIRIALVEERAESQRLRLPGRVVPEEDRVFVINSTVDGWITEARPSTTGSFVRKHEPLATFYSPEFLSAIQALLFALDSQDRVRRSALESEGQKAQLAQFDVNLQQFKDALRNLGMGPPQIQELMRTRRFVEQVDITAPADGFIITRNVFHGLRFDKGKELYRIADLSRVWILADVFERDARVLGPGTVGSVRHPQLDRTFEARLSPVLPQFDTATRTLKVRLEVDNRDFALRPDMFVDVELTGPPRRATVVPADAVLDSGLRKLVYVAVSHGLFEPRRVETGARFGDRIEIVKGLTAGDAIVVAGNFLVDSESRMRLAAAGGSGVSVRDPVCGMDVDPAKAGVSGRQTVYQGQTYYFCTDSCKLEFDRAPERYLAKSKGARPADHDHN